MLEALETTPTTADPFFWADFAELRAMIHPDRCFCRGDLSGIERRGRDTNSRRNLHAETQWRDLINFAGARTQEFGASYPFSVSTDGDTLELNYFASQFRPPTCASC